MTFEKGERRTKRRPSGDLGSGPLTPFRPLGQATPLGTLSPATDRLGAGIMDPNLASTAELAAARLPRPRTEAFAQAPPSILPRLGAPTGLPIAGAVRSVAALPGAVEGALAGPPTDILGRPAIANLLGRVGANIQGVQQGLATPTNIVDLIRLVRLGQMPPEVLQNYVDLLSGAR